MPAEVREREADGLILNDLARSEVPPFDKWYLRRRAQQAVLPFRCVAPGCMLIYGQTHGYSNRVVRLKQNYRILLRVGPEKILPRTTLEFPIEAVTGNNSRQDAAKSILNLPIRKVGPHLPEVGDVADVIADRGSLRL